MDNSYSNHQYYRYRFTARQHAVHAETARYCFSNSVRLFIRPMPVRV